jgi:hypothetical protein
LRSELRRMIRAFAIWTACALGDGFFDSVFVSATVVGIMSNCVAAIEPCAPGCTLMGPADVGLRFGMTDNAQMQSSFTALKGEPAASEAQSDETTACVQRFLAG